MKLLDGLNALNQAGSEIDVEIDRFEQLFLGDLFVGRVGDVDGAGTEEERFAPRCQHRDIGCELCDHGGQISYCAHADEGQVEAEVNVGTIADDRGYRSSYLVRRAYGADEQMGFCLVGDDVRRVAAGDQPDVQG